MSKSVLDWAMKSNYKRLGDYIKEVNIRDTDLTVNLLLGVSIQKKFIPSIANIHIGKWF